MLYRSPFGTTVGMSTASRREVHRRPRLGRRTWKLADNLNPTDIRVYAGCFSVPSCPLVLTLECSAPGVLSHPILAGNRGQTRSGAPLLTRPLLDCHLTVEDVWRVDREEKAELKLLPGKLNFRSVESAGMRMLFGSRAHNSYYKFTLIQLIAPHNILFLHFLSNELW